VVAVNGALEQVLPGWVRARGLAVYQLVFQGGQAVAALVWGALADRADVPAALLCAAAVMLLGAATAAFWPLPDVSGLDRSTATLPVPLLAAEPAPADGPVLVTLTYAVREENAAEFVAAMAAVERTRRRTGAVRWELYREGENPSRFVETYLVRTWAEHLQQHHRRLTGNDRDTVLRVHGLADAGPLIAHLLPAGPAGPQRASTPPRRQS
jgi:quinol monooxygenase YgiN